MNSYLLSIFLAFAGLFSFVVNGQAPKLKPGSYIQGTDKYKTLDKRKALSLTAAIEQGLRANYDQNQRDFSQEVLDLTWEDTKETFWLPQLQLNLDAGPQRVARIKAGQLGNQGNARRPTGTLGISMGDYTVFNWGKDYLAYLNNKESYRRSTTVFKEERRALKHSIIIKYFELVYFNRLVNIYRRQLRHASFVYRFNREKVAIRKVSKQEYYQSRSEFLRAQNSFQDATRNLKVAEEEMAFLITDQPSTRYILKDQLDYQRIQLPMEEAVRIGKESNPQVREANKDVKNAKRSYQLQLRENLPLPKFTVNLGAYNHTFAPGVHTTRYNTGLSGNQIDVVATINATWSLTGTGGFLNQRTTRRAHLNRSRSFSELTEAKHQTQSDIRRVYYKIKTYEQQIRILEAASVTNTKTFDVVLENYLNRKTAYINFQDSLLEAVASDIGLAELYFVHTREKVLLAQEMGIDEFPGKSFEALAKPAEVN